MCSKVRNLGDRRLIPHMYIHSRDALSECVDELEAEKVLSDGSRLSKLHIAPVYI